MIKKIFSQDAGFTLLEAMIALSILAISLLGIVNMLYVSSSDVAKGGKVTAASFLAQQKMDDFKVTPYNDLLSDATGNVNINPEGNPGGIYTRFWNVSTYTTAVPLPAGKIAGTRDIKTIIVYVTWPVGSGTQAVRLVTRRANDS